ncbi:MAG: hypothetical protein ABF242_04065 [Flavobacteriales bacterium]
MKKSKKFILAVVLILIAAVVILLSFPDLFDSKDETPADLVPTEIEAELGDEIFD